MKFFEGTLRLQPAKMPKNEDDREVLLAKQSRFQCITGVSMIVFGIVQMLFNNQYVTFAKQTEDLVGGLLIISYFILLIVLGRHIRYMLAPKDEFEQIKQTRSFSRAYSFLQLALILIISFSDIVEKVSWQGVLVTILGISSLIIYWSQRDVEA